MRRILFLIMVVFIVFSHISYAENENSAVITHDGNKITISGKLEKATGPQMVILVIGEYDNVLHTQRTMSGTDGTFLFNVVMPQNIEYGEYPYVIAAPALQGTIDYSEPANKEISVDVIINGYEVIFKGTLVGVVSEHEMTLLVGSIDNILYLNQVTTKSDGSFEFKAVMPEGMKAGEYPYTIGTSADIPAFKGTFQYGNDTTVEKIQVDVTVNGEVVVFKGNLVGATRQHEMTLLVGSIDNILYLNQVTSKPDGSFEFKAVMPEGLQSGEYSYTIGTSADAPKVVGKFLYESTNPETPEIPGEPEMPDIPVNSYIASGKEGEEFKVIASAANVTTFNDKVYTIEYDGDNVEPIGFFGAQSENFVGTGKKGNVNILSYDSNKVIFSIEDILISEGNAWSGILNVFKFRFKSGFSGTTELKLY